MISNNNVLDRSDALNRTNLSNAKLLIGGCSEENIVEPAVLVDAKTNKRIGNGGKIKNESPEALATNHSVGDGFTNLYTINSKPIFKDELKPSKTSKYITNSFSFFFCCYGYR